MRHRRDLLDGQYGAGRIGDVRDDDHPRARRHQPLELADGIALLHLADADIGDADARTVAPFGEEGRHQPTGVFDIRGNNLVAPLPGIPGDGDVHAVRRAPRDGDIVRRAAEDVRDGILRRRPRGHQAGVVVRGDPPLLQLLQHRFLHRRHRPARQRAAGARVQIDRVHDCRHLLPDLVNLCIHRDSHHALPFPTACSGNRRVSAKAPYQSSPQATDIRCAFRS